jgi:hypothetical protein
MLKVTFVDVDIDEATALADLSGAVTDLKSARSLAKYLAERFASGALDVDLIDAFSTAILVRYARPFMTGVRKCLGEEMLTSLAPDQRPLHKKFIDWRNKHIAHSVNAFEENQVVAYYNENTVAETGIQNIEVHENRVVGLSRQDLLDIQTLADWSVRGSCPRIWTI